MNKIRCIIVDDEAIAREVLDELLGRINFVKVVGSCKNAMEAFHVINIEEIDLIFLDINMPIVDGFVFLYEFEKFDYSIKDKCKVIILSSSDNKRDIDKIVNNDHVIKFITKPLTEIALEEVSQIV